MAIPTASRAPFSYNGLCEVIVLAARGKVRLRTSTYPLDRFQDVPNDLDAGRTVLVPRPVATTPPGES